MERLDGEIKYFIKMKATGKKTPQAKGNRTFF
jgi:hypothetical protein